MVTESKIVQTMSIIFRSHLLLTLTIVLVCHCVDHGQSLQTPDDPADSRLPDIMDLSAAVELLPEIASDHVENIMSGLLNSLPDSPSDRVPETDPLLSPKAEARSFCDVPISSERNTSLVCDHDELFSSTSNISEIADSVRSFSTWRWSCDKGLSGVDIAVVASNRFPNSKNAVAVPEIGEMRVNLATVKEFALNFMREWGVGDRACGHGAVLVVSREQSVVYIALTEKLRSVADIELLSYQAAAESHALLRAGTFTEGVLGIVERLRGIVDDRRQKPFGRLLFNSTEDIRKPNADSAAFLFGYFAADLIPSPMREWRACGRQGSGSICDPEGILGPAGMAEVDRAIERLRQVKRLTSGPPNPDQQLRLDMSVAVVSSMSADPDPSGYEIHIAAQRLRLSWSEGDIDPEDEFTHGTILLSTNQCVIGFDITDKPSRLWNESEPNTNNHPALFTGHMRELLKRGEVVSALVNAINNLEVAGIPPAPERSGFLEAIDWTGYFVKNHVLEMVIIGISVLFIIGFSVIWCCRHKAHQNPNEPGDELREEEEEIDAEISVVANDVPEQKAQNPDDPNQDDDWEIPSQEELDEAISDMLEHADLNEESVSEMSQDGSLPPRHLPPDRTISVSACPICFCPFGGQENASPPHALRCGHQFCSDCISEWVDRNAACPTCRQSVSHSRLKH
eukprot:472965_1